MLILNSPAFSFQISPAIGPLIHTIGQSFSGVLGSVSKSSSADQDPAAETSKKDKVVSGHEDLRCGLFERTSISGSRPGCHHCMLIEHFSTYCAEILGPRDPRSTLGESGSTQRTRLKAWSLESISFSLLVIDVVKLASLIKSQTCSPM